MNLIKLRARIGAVLVAFAAGLAVSGAAQAQALFLPAAASERAAVAGTNPSQHAKRSRLVRLDANVLADRIAPVNADNEADRAERAARLPDTLRLNLFDDVTPTLKRTSVSARATGGFTWEGIVPGQGIHEALLSVKNGQISGRVQLNNKLFSIDPVAGATHRITEVDGRSFPPEAPPRLRPQNRTESTQPAPNPQDSASEAAEANTIVRVFVAYTNRARSEAGGTVPMQAQIDQAIDLANQAYARGSIPMRLQLAGSMVVAYAEGNGTPSRFEINLEDLTDGQQFATVRSRRNQTNADLVVLLRSDPANCGTQCVCGIAWFPGAGVMPTPSAATRETGFSVTAHSCITNLSFHHELGHNMGLQHDRFVVSGNPGTNFYNFGYVNKPRLKRTIMAYNNACAPDFCDRINWFSSPTIRATGNVVIGRARNTAGAADNTLRLKQTRTPISQYE